MDLLTLLLIVLIVLAITGGVGYGGGVYRGPGIGLGGILLIIPADPAAHLSAGPKWAESTWGPTRSAAS